jgi:HSP20 family protein
MTVSTTPRTVTRFDRSFDQLVSSLFDPRRPAGPVIDATWNGDEYVLTVDLPGVAASAVDVEVSGTTLAIAAKSGNLDWKRSLRLGGRLDPEKVSAHHVDGRLTVRIGTIDAPVARRVAVASEAPTAAVEATTVEAVESGDQPNATNSAG